MHCSASFSVRCPCSPQASLGLLFPYIPAHIPFWDIRALPRPWGLDTDAYPPPPHLKSRIVKDMAFSSSPVWMWELDDKKGWAPKNWCLWSMVMQKTLDSLLDSKEIQPVHPKWNQSWIFIGRTDGEAKASVLWPPDAKNWLTGKDADAEKDWRQEEKGMTEDKMVGWHHRLEGHEFE